MFCEKNPLALRALPPRGEKICLFWRFFSPRGRCREATEGSLSPKNKPINELFKNKFKNFVFYLLDLLPLKKYFKK
jgi:hypothetical protein